MSYLEYEQKFKNNKNHIKKVKKTWIFLQNLIFLSENNFPLQQRMLVAVESEEEEIETILTLWKEHQINAPDIIFSLASFSVNGFRFFIFKGRQKNSFRFALSSV